MKDKTWTWIDKYGTWLRPVQPRLCVKCGYEGYFKLKKTKTPMLSMPFKEICPQCHVQIEMKEGDRVAAYIIPSKENQELAEKSGKTFQELANEVFENLIMEFDPKTGKARLVRKSDGKTIFES
jgi:hypothetical protein